MLQLLNNIHMLSLYWILFLNQLFNYKISVRKCTQHGATDPDLSRSYNILTSSWVRSGASSYNFAYMPCACYLNNSPRSASCSIVSCNIAPTIGLTRVSPSTKLTLTKELTRCQTVFNGIVHCCLSPMGAMSRAIPYFRGYNLQFTIKFHDMDVWQMI